MRGISKPALALEGGILRLFDTGHRWPEIEIWGGRSYMDRSVEDELLLRSEFPHGIRLAWRDYEALHKPVA